MGNSKYLDSLSQDEYKNITKKLWNIQSHKCFICGKDIDLELSDTNIDHIKPLVNGGKDSVDNFGLTHESCNKSKQDADLEVARCISSLNDIYKIAEANKESVSLKHVLRFFEGSKYDFKYKIDGDTLEYSFSELGMNDVKKTEIFTDKLSKEKTAFIKVPIEYLFHDEKINPRGINSSINLLIKEFHKPNPQLHFALARIDDNKIKIFDGQHKTVAQLMLGVKEVVLRLFINPDIERLIDTNLIAGSKLKQIVFDKAIVRELHDTQYTDRIRKYQKDHGLFEDDFSFSETDLVNHFKGERGNVKQFIVDSLKASVTRDPNNKLHDYMSFEGKDTKYPLSYSTFQKTILSIFIDPKNILSTPINYKMDEGINPRTIEKEQLIKLCNIIADIILVDKYDFEIGTNKIEDKIVNHRDEDITDDHLISCRIMKEEIVYNWVTFVEMVIKNYFAITGVYIKNDNSLFQYPFPNQLWTNISNFLTSLRDLPLWKNRTLSATVFGGRQNNKFWETIFTTGNTPDGTPLLARPLEINEMIKEK